MLDPKKVFEDYFKEWIYFYPLEASFLGFDILNEIDEIPVPINEEFRKKEIAFYKKYKEITKKIEIDKDEKLKIYLDAFKFSLKLSLKELSYPDNLLPINHFYSFHLIFPSISSGLGQNFINKRDLEKFHKKINYFERWSEEVISNLKEGIKLKITLPLPVIERVISQLEFFIKKEKKENPCFKPIFLLEKDYKGKEKEKIIKIFENEIKKKVIKSYEKIYNFLKERYLKYCINNIGLWNFPGGIDWYRAKILKYTTLKLDPEEIYKEGEEGLKILKETSKVIKDEEISLKDPLKFLKNHIKEIKKATIKYFYKLPERDFKILPAEEHKEETAPLGEYFTGGFGKKSQPVFYLNLKLAKNKSPNEILAIFFHEIIPGHHLQLSLQRENRKLPSFLRYHFFDSFVEGWAFYAENLAYEIGLVNDERYKGAILKNQIWRTLRLVLDTGIHIGKINKEKAISILMEEANFTKKHSEIEILRYAVLPGQALTYKIGENFFIKLKKEAKNRLKNNFNLKDFNKMLLEDGSLPLPVLQNKFKNWLKEKLKSHQY